MTEKIRTRSRPVQGFQWITDETPAWAHMAMVGDNPRLFESTDRIDTSLYISNPGGGLMRIRPGDWIIQEIGGAIVGCPWDVFGLFYEIVEET